MVLMDWGQGGSVWNTTDGGMIVLSVILLLSLFVSDEGA